MTSRVFPIDDASRIAEVRRHGIAFAQSEGLSENAISNVAILTTELSTNLLKHAVGGEIHLSPLSDRDGRGVEILSIDRGPGIANLRSCLDDGYSSTGTPGTGLGAVTRLSTSFDAYSEFGRGSVFVSRLQVAAKPSSAAPRVTSGIVSKPVGNEPVSGDAWAIKHSDGGSLILLSDGLGHGSGAAEASTQAIAAFVQSNEDAPAAIVQQLHLALKGTRGAAIAVAYLDYEQMECRFAGIGNIAGRIIGVEATSNMVSHVGTAGYEARRFQEFKYKMPPQSYVVMHSDGLTSSWTLSGYAGVLKHDPAVIAALLYRDAARGRDDICVMVMRRNHTA